MKEGGECTECRVGMSKHEKRVMGGRMKRAKDDEDDDGDDEPRERTSNED
jgi:hypothetical protein